jgi:UrcA family protein
MSKHSRTALLAAAALAVPALGVAAAGAAVDPDSVQVRSEVVTYDAARIDDARSAERLFFRIRKAAAEVCSIASHPVGYELWEEHACEAEAVEEAVRETGLPELNEFYVRRR